MAETEINLENGAGKTVWSEEYERVPLKQRLKLLLASHRVSADSELKSERQIPVLPPNVGVAAAEKRENGHCDVQHLQSGCSAEEQVIEMVERHGGELGDSNHHENLLLKVESAGNCVESPSATYVDGSILAGNQAVISEPEMGDESLDELDYVVLKERLRRLLTSKCLGSASIKAEENSAGVVKGELVFGDQRHVPGNQIHDIHRTFISSSSKDTEFFKHESGGGKTLLSGAVRTVQGSAIPNLAKIKIEPPNYDEFQSSNVTTSGQMSFRNLVPVKTEVQVVGNADEDELDHMLLRERMKLLSSSDGPSLDIHQGSECFSKMVPSALGCRPVASKPSLSLKVNRSRKRRKTLTDSIETAMEEDAPGLLQVLIDKGVSVNEIKLYGELESNDALDDSSTNDNFAELEVVIVREVDGMIDLCTCVKPDTIAIFYNFWQVLGCLPLLFSQRASLLKFGPLRCARGEKASYCLECLFSLVEQARYLQFRNWPVEWGWCRDLQSFIFVFERHNRIVLERPEYGYATYFFELADSLPIDWQIKRLVIAMKLTSCSRVTLIENKALMVGDDLTEGEARVLMEYGWVPNTGLGTMLNYYDRVVHDRKTEGSSEWRSKIGKLLMDGYNGGTIISAGIPRKVAEYDVAHPQEIKLELSLRMLVADWEIDSY
ncbi:hypothetical protein Sango_0250100 [Sesamum angolense]|uniref:Uncharacterized protein n=1 Tax=Sesamum angolense TaxID=2727404 RepID=A0AAE2C7E2_9LAMI|nr:hypothetical protein Sango_0250100 [Sesamum angolense]